MWLFTRYGFFSATVSPLDLSKIQVRARAKEDLKNLREFMQISLDPDRFSVVEKAEIIETHDADYRYRLLLPKKTWSKIVEALADDIDYSNFKNQITDWNRHGLYLQVWSIMLRLQTHNSLDDR